MAEGDVGELIVAVNEVAENLEDLHVELTGVRDHINKNFLKKEEANRRAEKFKTVGVLAGTVLLCLGLVVFGFVLYLREETTKLCRQDRLAQRELIQTAIADRQPLATSTPEVRAAIEEQNVRIREVREKLLKLDGSQPEKC